MTISGKQFIRGAAATLSIAALALTAACGSDTAQDAADNTQANSGDLTQQTVTPGKLTIATGDPAYEPWVLNDDPESGEGYEAAVATTWCGPARPSTRPSPPARRTGI